MGTTVLAMLAGKGVQQLTVLAEDLGVVPSMPVAGHNHL